MESLILVEYKSVGSVKKCRLIKKCRFVRIKKMKKCKFWNWTEFSKKYYFLQQFNKIFIELLKKIIFLKKFYSKISHWNSYSRNIDKMIFWMILSTSSKLKNKQELESSFELLKKDFFLSIPSCLEKDEEFLLKLSFWIHHLSTFFLSCWSCEELEENQCSKALANISNS